MEFFSDSMEPLDFMEQFRLDGAIESRKESFCDTFVVPHKHRGFIESNKTCILDIFGVPHKPCVRHRLLFRKKSISDTFGVPLCSPCASNKKSIPDIFGVPHKPGLRRAEEEVFL